jgi:mono/diheme cytochrome c family protein
LLLCLVAASAFLTPRLLNFLANQQTALPAPLQDRTSAAKILEQRQQALAQLDSYGWVNQAAGIVHIPIAQAIMLIAKTGLPVGAPVAATTSSAAQPATGSAVLSTTTTATLEPAQIDFQADILPLFEQHCLDCHGNEDPEKNLQLTNYKNVMAGSDDGPVIKPGDPQNSYLVELVSKGRMPKRGKKFTPAEVALIAAWVQAGATEKAASPRPAGQVAQVNTPQTTITSTAALTPTAALSVTQPAVALDPATIDYKKDVQPIFEQHCLDCHGNEDPEKGLQLTSYKNVLAGSDNGPVIKPGAPEDSYLIQQVVKGRMPKRGKKLTSAEITILTAWVQGGAQEKASAPVASGAISQTATISMAQTTASNGTAITATATVTAVAAVPVIDPATVNFATDVFPIFKDHCIECHGYEDPEHGLQLTSYSNIMAGSDDGPVIKPGDPENSYLVELVTKGRMPKRGKKLTPEQVAIITAWVKGGALETTGTQAATEQTAQSAPATPTTGDTETATATATPTNTRVATKTLTATATVTPPATATRAATATQTATPKAALANQGATATTTKTPTATSTATVQPTTASTATKAATPTPQSTATKQATATPTATSAPTTASQTTTSTTALTTTIPVVDPASVSYSKDVQPIFEQHCLDCHGYEDPEKGLQLTSQSAVLSGSEDGPVIEPGNPEKSYLIEQITKGRMPKRGKKLTPEEIAIITAWVKAGAPDN